MGESYIGVMSGTSLDGIDVVLADIETPFKLKVRGALHWPFGTELRDQLLHMLQAESLPPQAILAANQVLGEIFAEAIQALLQQTDVTSEKVTAIGLHGITFQHRPEAISALGGHGRGSWQLGDPQWVRQKTGITTISDFRGADMALGGEGAPLVPFLDRLLFASEDQYRVLLNLGGIANLTFLQPNEPVRAYDSGPANMLIDGLMRRHPNGHQKFDPEGSHGQAGTLLPDVLADCLKHEYFSKKPPKSTGRELFGRPFLERFFPMEHRPYNDLVHTATVLTAYSIAAAVKDYAGVPLDQVHLIPAGGGVHNRFLMDKLRGFLPQVNFLPIGELGVDADQKEALLMATLAWAHIHRIPANLPSVTGASASTVLGMATA